MHLTWVAALAATALLAGCASSGNGDTSADAGSETTAEWTPVEPAPQTTPSETLRVDIPLTEAPPTGKTVGMVTLPSPQYEHSAETLVDAADAVGWDVDVFTYTTDAGAAVQQAINAGVDYILLNSIPSATVKPQLDAAFAAGIPVVNGASADDSDPDKLYYTTLRSGEFFLLTTDWIMNDAQGQANVVDFTSLQFEFFQGTNALLEDAFAAKCADCTFDTLDFTLDQIAAGEVPGIAVSYLQTHPEVNYIHVSLPGIMAGLVPALESAGLLDQVTITGHGPGQAEIRDIAAGKINGWTSSVHPMWGWQHMDVLVRLAAGEEITAEYLENPGVAAQPVDDWVIDTPEVASELVDLPWGWEGPADFREQYLALWRLSK